MRLKAYLTVGALAISVFGLGSTHATPIVGGIMFSDTFAASDLANSTTSIVSALTTIPVDPPELAQGCSGVFATGGACIPNSGTFAASFVLASPITTQQLFTYNGFSFTVTSLVGSIASTGLTCGATTCADSLAFDAIGFVTGNGLTQSAMSMHWQADGACSRNPTGGLSCATASATGHWLATITAVPEPNVLALVGMGLGLLGFALRRPAR